MRLASWNVNSLKARQARVEAWLAEQAPDVCCLQETKSTDGAFPSGAFAALGYESAHHGNGRWNGVAILSRVGLEEERAGFVDDEAGSIEECRILSARCGGVRVFSVYVPNGRAVGTEHYEAKLAWLGRLRAELEATASPEEDVVVCGDFNVAPEDRDVFDIARFAGATHVTPAERRALGAVMEWGLVDAMRQVHPEGDGPFSWWDYRAGAFHKGEGMRIDLALCSAPIGRRVTAAWVDREARKKGKLEGAPSDHAPIVVDWEG